MSGARCLPGGPRALAVAWLTACLVAALVVVTAPAPVRAQERDCAEPGETYQPVPWSQRMLAPERVWPFTRGGGVTVAVLSSGVDAGAPQLAGRVRAGFDAVAGSGAADDDCLGLGTQVAGVIAAGSSPDLGFAGMAPAATVLPVRVVDDRQFGAPVAEPDVLADGLRWAAERADIVVVSVPAYDDDPDLEAAVAEALGRGVLVVAAAGDLGGETDGNPEPYPAVYDGVLAVGAVDPTVTRWSGSQFGDFVDLVAPGAEVVTVQRGEGMVAVDGTGVAAGFVAGAAALVLAADPGASPEEVARRLVVSTTPAPGGPRSAEYGRGVVDPYAAVHERLVAASPASQSAVTRPVVDPRPEWIRSRGLAVAGALGALGLVVAVITAAVALPRGRRRLWRPAVAAPPANSGEPAEPGPPLQLFDKH